MVPLIRAFVLLPAGVARMPFWRFTVLSFLGSIPWVLALAFAGHALGHDWTRRARALSTSTTWSSRSSSSGSSTRFSGGTEGSDAGRPAG